MNTWSRNDRIALGSLIVAIVAIAVSFAQKEIRIFLKLDPSVETTSSPTVSSNSPKTSPSSLLSPQPAHPKVNQPEKQISLYKEELSADVWLEMISIPGGSYIMGEDPKEKYGSPYDEPRHQVTIAPFYLGKYEITQDQYEAIMGNNPSKYIGRDLPVDHVSWSMAAQFCKALSSKTGKNYQLPTEAQWEYACRAGTDDEYIFNDNYSKLNIYAWYRYNSGMKPHPVGQKKPNKWGLYDMLGNVNEWCEDVWHKDYNGAPSDGSAWITGGSKTGESSEGEDRVIRGCSWFHDSVRYNCRIADRIGMSPQGQFDTWGLRVVMIK